MGVTTNLEDFDLDKAFDQLKTLKKLETVLNGLVAFAEIRDEADAGDWVVVANTADLVRCQIDDIRTNLFELFDHGDTEE